MPIVYTWMHPFLTAEFLSTILWHFYPLINLYLHLIKPNLVAIEGVNIEHKFFDLDKISPMVLTFHL